MWIASLEISNMLCAVFHWEFSWPKILEHKLFQNASSKLVFEASILGATSGLRIIHLNSRETEIQHVTYFGKLSHSTRFINMSPVKVFY